MTTGVDVAQGAGFGAATTLEGFERDELALDVDDRGRALLAGTRGDSGALVLAERPRGGAFAVSQVVRNAGGDPREPAVASAGRGAAIVAWRSRAGVLALVREPGGALPAEPVVLAPSGQRPQVAIAPDGEAVVTWLQGGRVRAAHRPAGEGFARAVTLSATRASAARVAMHADGTAVLAWARRPRIEATTITDGDVATPQRIGTAPQDGRVAVAAGGARTAVVAWLTKRTVERVVRRNGRFGEPRTLRTVPRTELFLRNGPRAAVTPQGRPIVAWAQDGPTPDDRRRTRLYVDGALQTTQPGFTQLTGLAVHRGEPVLAWRRDALTRRTSFSAGLGLLEPPVTLGSLSEGEGPVVAAGGGELVTAWAFRGGDRAAAVTRWAAGR